MDQKIEAQIERFKKGFPWMEIVAPATPERGIEVLTDEQAQDAIAYSETAEVAGRCKFVPASGAASRMFKAVFAHDPQAVGKLADELEKFAFYDPEIFGKAPFEPIATADKLLGPEGLDYGSKPKGVLKFHRYSDGARTAFAEHLVEGQEYMRNADGSVNLVVTISPEHRELFEAALAEVKDKYEARYGVKYNVSFTYQDKSTDTVAVDMQNRPFLTDIGEMLFRPAGHGALIHNLNDIDAELVSIKNIDNVCREGMLPITAKWKKVLMGRALQLRDNIRGYIYALDQIASSEVIPFGYTPVLAANLGPQIDVWSSDEVQDLCNEIQNFLYDEFCIEMPEAHDCKARALALRAKLDRPVRVCGMVRNLGEPGGGPFIIRGKDGSTSLQILESVQINKDDAKACAALSSATHFNPVDLVCCLRDCNGDKFDLPSFVDEDAGFISSKSYQGRELKALELPGLWNGAMSDWNTHFVEVPIETFNPVKVVLDLLRPAHQS